MRREWTERGSILLLAAFGLLVLMVFLALVVNQGGLILVKMKAQNSVDASAWSGAVLQARGLNILSGLNSYLENTAQVYEVERELWVLALALDQGKPEGPAQKGWRRLYQTSLSKICDPAALEKIRCEGSMLVEKFNGKSAGSGGCRASIGSRSGGKTAIPEESGDIGMKNISPFSWLDLNGSDFNSWSMNFHQSGKSPRLSVKIEDGTRKFMTGAGANIVSGGIICQIPPQWVLKDDYQKYQYVLSAVSTPPAAPLYFSSFFGHGDKVYAVAKAKPVRSGDSSLKLLKSEWQAKLVSVAGNEEERMVFDDFRRSAEGKSLGFQQVPTRPMLH